MTIQPALMPPVIVSPTLAADALVAKLRSEQRQVLHMGFGQAPFAAASRLAAALSAHAHETSYLPVAGLPELRKAVAEHQHRLIGTDPDTVDVLVAPGSKLILYAVQMAVTGDLLLPIPSWVSYAPQAAMLGQKTIPVPAVLSEAGYVIDAATLDTAIGDARKAGLNPTKIMLNYPNNPTGLTIPDHALEAIAEVCVRQGIVIIADEIYGRLTFGGPYRSISAHAPEHTVVTTGLSKHLSLGGWRVGVGVIPKSMTGLFDAMIGIASETWSCVSAPVQRAAVEAYRGHDDIEAFIGECTALHACVTSYVAERFNAMGIPCIPAQGGFYVWPDFSALGGAFATSAALSEALIAEQGIVSLPGEAFGEAPATLRLRLSTCDYDGAEALAFLRGRVEPLSDADVAAFAPRVTRAMDGFEAFVAAHRGA